MTEKRCPKCKQRIEVWDQRVRADQWQQSATEKLGFIVRVGYRLRRDLNTWNPWRLRRAVRQSEAELARLWGQGGFAPAPWRPGGIPFDSEDTLGKKVT